MRRRLFRIARWVALTSIVAFIAIQFVPYGWWHEKPPYSYVAPMSWLVRRDVEDGRHELNFSEWNRDSGEADDAVETVVEGSMPPDRYTVLHPDARLSDDEQRRLVRALELMEERD
jgi:hypothetical protein